MKKEITTVFLTLATVLGFAQNEQPAPNLLQIENKPALPSIEEKVVPNRSFGYLRMGVADSQVPRDTQQMLPGLGLGYRLISGYSAFDLSASFNRREFHKPDGKLRTFHYTLPKANYLYYVSAEGNNSFYAGGGLAWSGVRTEDEREFHGLVPNVAVGYEMGRNKKLRSFVQFDASQPAIAASQTGALPGPYAELSLGAGF